MRGRDSESMCRAGVNESDVSELGNNKSAQDTKRLERKYADE